ncbi:hypothetical protein CBL_08430 [Carabus blaptoides fortunei]
MQRSHNIPISGPILQAKANDFARRLALEYFRCTVGWIQLFRKRHNTVFGILSGEAADVSEEISNEWLNTVWPNLRKVYKDEEIFNADETGLFFRMMPDKTMKFNPFITNGTYTSQAKNKKLLSEKELLEIAEKMFDSDASESDPYATDSDSDYLPDEDTDNKNDDRHLFFKYHPKQDISDPVLKKAFYRKDGSNRKWLTYRMEDRRHVHVRVEEHACAEAYFLRNNNANLDNLPFYNQMSVYRAQIRKRREILQRIIDIVKFIGKRGLSYRGDKLEAAYSLEDMSTDHGNFLELVVLLSKYDMNLKDHLKDCIENSKKLHESQKVSVGMERRFLANEQLYADFSYLDPRRFPAIRYNKLQSGELEELSKLLLKFDETATGENLRTELRNLALHWEKLKNSELEDYKIIKEDNSNEDNDELTLEKEEEMSQSGPGLYTEDEIQTAQEAIMFGLERAAVSNILTRKIAGLEVDAQGTSALNLFNKKELEQIAKSTIRQLWGWFEHLGDEVEESKSDSESEQDGDELSSDEEESDADTEFYLARDKITKWKKSHHQNHVGKEGDGIEKFGLVMSIKRFKLLLRVLRFADRTTRSERKAFDRLASIREVFDKFVENCQKSYCLGENVTIDEMLPGFRGSRLKNDIHIQCRDICCVSNKPTDVVMRLAKPIFGSGRNITADNWFTDFNLVDELKSQSVHRNIKRWPMVVFFAMLNIGGINSQVIYLGNQLEPLRRRVFLKTLAHELTIGKLQRRSQTTSGLHTSMQVRLKRFLPVDDRIKSPVLPKKEADAPPALWNGNKKIDELCVQKMQPRDLPVPCQHCLGCLFFRLWVHSFN